MTMKTMKRTLLVLLSTIFVLALLPARAQITYYVDCVNGNNSNNGQSASTAWKGLHSANSAAFNGGDTLLLKRGCVWNWHLTPAVTASGTSVFSIDAYGNGAPPTIQNKFTVTGFTAVSGHANVYVAAVTSPSEGGGFNPYRVDAVKINGVWAPCVGMNDVANDDNFCGPAAVGGLAALSTAAIANSWYYDGNYTGGGSYSYNCATAGVGATNDCGNLYVYSPSGTPTSVQVTMDGAAQLILLSSVSYISIQHVKLQSYSWYGIEVKGTSDNLVIANVYGDTDVPFNFHGVGVYMHQSNAAANIQVLNTEFHRGYYGYQFAGGITAVTLSNCKAYFNRAAGLADLTTSGVSVAYDHCHFYGNGVGTPIANDIAINPNTSAPGGVAGVGNIAPNTDPHVVSWQNYTPRFTLNYRGPGNSFGSDVALNAQLATLGSTPLSIAIATNYSTSTSLIPQFNAWLAAGYDLNSAGLSSASYANSSAINVKYLGTCSSVLLTVTGTPAASVAIAASGGTCPSGDNFSFTVTATSTLSQLKAALAANADYSVAWWQPCGSCAWVDGSAMLARDLATVSGQSVASTYTLAMNPDQFLKDETALSQAWMQANLTGYGSTWVYLYPATLFNPTATGLQTIEQDVAGSGTPPYAGAVGAGNMELGRDGLAGGFDAVASNGVDAQGLTAYSLSGWANLQPTALQAAVQAAVEKASVWGVPQTLYWQSGELSNSQLAFIISFLNAAGASLSTNSGLIGFLTSSPHVQVASLPSGFCSCWAWTPEVGGLNLAPTYLSPTVGAGSTLSSSYQYDVNGVPQPQTWSAIDAKTAATVSKSGWDIGAQALVPLLTGGLRPGH
jgi:hypothetical protein